MKLILKDKSAIELDNGNNQNQFIVSYCDESELTSIEALLTNENLSDAKYMIESEVVETLKNKVLSGSKRNIITHNATYYIVDSKSAEMEQLQAKFEIQESIITELSAMVDLLLVTTLEPTDDEIIEELEEPLTEEGVEDDVQQA